MGPFQVESLGGKKYAFVCVDDYSRYSWVDFLREKSDAIKDFITLCTRLQREKGVSISSLGSDHGREFEKIQFF